MNAKTEMLIYQLLWTGDVLTRPTFKSISNSFEAWAYRNGLQRRLWELERSKMLESQTVDRMERVHRLTTAGRLKAMGGRDPIREWERSWDGKWRMVMFDLPESQRSTRNAVRKQLRSAQFGCLQQSLWISPDPADTMRQKLRGKMVNTKTLIFIEGHPCGGESNSDLVAGAWDFGKIDSCYGELIAHLQKFERFQKPGSRREFLGWMETERMLWTRCVAKDPMLPSPLLPAGYRGRIAWDLKVQTATHTESTIDSLSE